MLSFHCLASVVEAKPLKQGGAAGATKTAPCVLTVAGSDSGAGAGIQADIKTCAARGVFCCSAIASVTAQNTLGVQGIHNVPADFVRQQMESVFSDFQVDVVKTGMLPSPAIVQAVSSCIKSQPIRALVVDPVMVATSGHELASSAILDSLRNDLLPLASIVTPNISEAATLTGGKAITSIAHMKDAAAAIHEMGSRFVLVKGGHMQGTDDIIDILYDGRDWHELHGKRINTRNTHGTGCTLAASIAAELVKGLEMLPAVIAAKHYIEDALEHSLGLHFGTGPQGPMNHLFQLAHWEKKPSSKFDPRCLFLYAVTDSGMNRRWNRSTQEAVEAAIAGGATIVQIREKDSETLDMIKDAEASLQLARKHGVPLLINDRVDVALACNADGVHLGQTDMPVSTARALLGADKIIGASCKTVEQAMRAWEEGADYIGCGGVFPTSTKQNNKTVGIAGLRQVCEASPLPVVAIGGISAGNVQQVLQPSVPKLHGVAVVSAVFDQADVQSATGKLRATLLPLLSKSWASKCGSEAFSLAETA